MTKLAGFTSILLIWGALTASGQETEHEDDKGVQRVYRNADLERGRLLLAQGLNYEAIIELEKAWQRDNYSRDNPEVYALLGRAYRYVGRYEDALQAIEAAIACDPSDLSLWAQRSVIAAGLGSREQRVPSPPWIPLAPAPEALREVLAIGPPGGWSKEQIPEMARIYIRYTIALRRAAWKNAVEGFLRIALSETLGTALGTCNTQDATVCLNELAALMSRPNFSRMPDEVRVYALWFGARKQADLGNYVHSLEALQDLINLGGAELPGIDVQGLVLKIQRHAFASVSFDLSTGAYYHSDRQNFINIDDLKTEDELAHEWAGEERLRRQRDPAYRYGMISYEHDHGAIFEIWVKSWKEPARSRLVALLAARIQEGKFELPVKFLLHQFAEDAMDWTISSKEDTLRKRLDEAILKASPENVSEGVALGYQVALRLEEFRQYWSRRPQTEVMP